MLYLIGLGLEKEDLSVKALSAIKRCKKIYLESYTTKLPYSVKELERFIKKKVFIANRELLEQQSQQLIDEAKAYNVAVLVYGDPLAATTHLALLLEAKKQKVKTQVVHAPSILTAISELGLQLYKFGKTVSLPKWSADFKPTSWYELIKQNLAAQAHSLLLVDKGLTAEAALRQLKSVAEKPFLDQFIILASRLGTQKQKVIKGKLKELLQQELKALKEPFCIIIPATLHFVEAEALEALC